MANFIPKGSIVTFYKEILIYQAMEICKGKKTVPVIFSLVYVCEMYVFYNYVPPFVYCKYELFQEM